MRFSNAIWTWLITAVLAFFALPITPMALRWPVRILVGIALVFCLFALIRKMVSIPKPRRVKFFLPRFLAIAVVSVSAIAVYPHVVLKTLQLVGKRPTGYSKVFVSHASELQQELEKRNTRLTLLAMPYSGSFFPDGKRHDALSTDFENALVHQTFEQLERAGIQTIDLFDIFEKHASTRDAWDKDFFHLTNDSIAAITPQLVEILDGHGVTPAASREESKLVLMGECFANDFGRQIRKTHSGWKHLSVLFAQGGAERVSNNLFLFQNEYLQNTSHILWLVPYQMLASAAIPPLNTKPNIGNNEIRSASLKVISSLGWTGDRSEYESRLKELPYPDALVEIVCEDADKTDKIVLYGPGIENRQPLLLSRLRPGQLITANLIPFESHTAENPKTSRTYIINNTAPFDLKRYWIHSWTYLR